MQKLILFNSVLVGMAAHIFSSLDVPMLVKSKTDGLISSFFWAKQGTRGIHWLSRNIIQFPKEKGGLGIRNLNLLNQAKLMKPVWRMYLNPQLLVSKVYKATQQFALNTGSQVTVLGNSFS